MRANQHEMYIPYIYHQDKEGKIKKRSRTVEHVVKNNEDGINMENLYFHVNATWDNQTQHAAKTNKKFSKG